MCLAASDLVRCAAIAAALGAITGCGFSAPGVPDATSTIDAVQSTEQPPKPCSTWVPGDPAIRLCLELEDPTLSMIARDSSALHHDASVAAVSTMQRGDTNEQAMALTASSRVTIAEAPDLDVQPNLTFGLWMFATVLPDGMAATGVLSNGSEYSLALLADGNIRCTVAGRRAASRYPGAQLATLGHWIHAACSYDGQRVRVYLGGELSACESHETLTVTPNTTGLVIGARNDGVTAPPFVGGIDDVHVYARTVTPLELCSVTGIPMLACNQLCP